MDSWACASMHSIFDGAMHSHNKHAVLRAGVLEISSLRERKAFGA